METIHHLALRISRIGALIGGFLLLFAAIIIGVDVFLRLFFSKSIGGADELSGYALAISSAWGFSFALLHRAHIRIDSFYDLCSPRVRASLDLLSLLGFILFIGLMSQYAWGVLAQSVVSNARSISALSVPVAIPQMFWFVGLVFLLLVLLLLLVEGGTAFARGDLRALFRLIGSKTIAEEVHEERVEQSGRKAELERRS
jgi:TRAP-type C4-dicarboxylate transport system permease small subunit